MASRCDLIIRNAPVFGGLGNPRFVADVGVIGDRIIAVGDLGRVEGDRDIDDEGLALAPGFIDAHVHDNGAVLMRTGMHAAQNVAGPHHRRRHCGISLSPG